MMATISIIMNAATRKTIGGEIRHIVHLQWLEQSEKGFEWAKLMPMADCAA
jgi:hypothetical protein